MKQMRLVLLFFTFLAAGCLAEDQPDPTRAEPRTADYSWMPLSEWHERHQADKNIAAAGEAKLLFVGDSITQGWPEALWQEHFAPYGAANFGIGGDKTQNVLWRLDNGGAGNLQPEVVNVLVGVNNFGFDNATPKEVAQGVTAVVDKVHQKFPQAHIVVNGILPWGEKISDPRRSRIAVANAVIAGLDKRDYVSYHDFGEAFLQEDGSISKALMADFLHPTALGYEVYAEELAPIIDDLMQTEK